MQLWTIQMNTYSHTLFSLEDMIIMLASISKHLKYLHVFSGKSHTLFNFGEFKGFIVSIGIYFVLLKDAAAFQ